MLAAYGEPERLQTKPEASRQAGRAHGSWNHKRHVASVASSIVGVGSQAVARALVSGQSALSLALGGKRKGGPTGAPPAYMVASYMEETPSPTIMQGPGCSRVSPKGAPRRPLS